jgi:hypothetical protein
MLRLSVHPRTTEQAVEATDSSPEYSLSAERRVPQDHPLRPMRAMAAAALQQFSEGCDAIYASSGHGRRLRRVARIVVADVVHGA